MTLNKSRAVLYRKGKPTEDLLLILNGSVCVIVDDIEDQGQEMVVSYLNPGEFFSEMGLFGKEQPTADLVARTPCEFGRISYQDFRAIRQQFPDVLYALTTQIGQRLKKGPASLRTLHLSASTGVFTGNSFGSPHCPRPLPTLMGCKFG